MKISVYYEFHDEDIKPFMLLIKFKPGALQWDKSFLYVHLDTPFLRFMADEFADGILSATILLEDLTVSPLKPGQFGIHLPPVRVRCAGYGLENIEQLLVRMCDIEDVLQMDSNNYYEWR